MENQIHLRISTYNKPIYSMRMVEFHQNSSKTVYWLKILYGYKAVRGFTVALESI